MKSYSGWFAFVLLLGCVIGFGAGRFDRIAEAQSIDNKTSRWLAGTVSIAAGQDAFMLFDSQTNRLATYMVTANKKLEVIAVREVSYDMKPVMWGKQEPTVQEMRDAWEKSEKDKADKAEHEKK